MNYLTNYYKNLSEQLQGQIDVLEQLIEAYVLSPNEARAAPAFDDGPIDYRKKGRDRADVLGQMLAAASYDGVNDHERDAFERIIADTQTSTAERSSRGYSGLLGFGPGPKQSGTQANAQHLRTALGAVRRLNQDPKFAEHLTKTMAPKFTGEVIDRAIDIDNLEDYQFFGTRERARVSRISDKHSKDLPPSTKVTDLTTEFGRRMNAQSPSDEKYFGPHEYPTQFPVSMVSKLLSRRARENSQNTNPGQ
jgi:hypothetical protein